MWIFKRWYNRLRVYFSGNWPVVYCLCERRKGVIKFIFAGGTAAAVDLFFLYVFYDLLSWDIIRSSSIAFIFAFIVSFCLQKFWTFRDKSPKRIISQLLIFLLNALIGLYLNGLAIHILVSHYKIWYLLAQIIINLLLAIWNFIFFRFWVFNIKKK